jgi:hypothetical protein
MWRTVAFDPAVRAAYVAALDDVRGGAVAAGHFFPEEFPDRTAERLCQFLSSGG